MSETNESLDLSALENDYDIVGEVRAAGGARTFTASRKDTGAKRRDDESGVLISVVTTPEGDEGNALSHLAADTKLLADLTHRRLMPVYEGRWIGTDAFAVVTQRTTDPSLAQMLATGETFSTPRIAAILREVNGLLEWAREHNIVHRNVTADRIFLEPKTDRVRVSFGVAPIRRLKHVDPETVDARTIVRLTMAMLTGSEDPATYEGESLGELRPDLPEQLREATTALLDENHAHSASDVAAYLALVGMAGPLFAGETEAERIREESLGEQRTEREKLAEERTTFEQTMARERANFERVMEEARENFDQLMATEREKLAKDKAELQRAATAERAALVAKRAELERVVADQRREMERVAADDRRRIDALRAEIKRAGDLELERKRQATLQEISDADSALDSAEYATPLFVPPVMSPLQELVFDDDSVLMRDDEEVVVPPPVMTTPMGTPVQQPEARVLATTTPNRWLVPTALAVLVAIIGVAAIALSRRDSQAPPPPARVVTTPTTNAVVAQTTAPVLPPPAVPLPSPSAITDSSAGSVSAAADSIKKAEAAAAARRKRRLVRDSIARHDSLFPDDSLAQARRAARERRDSLAKKDSVRPDTIPD
jgi:hypothetical protein